MDNAALHNRGADERSTVLHACHMDPAKLYDEHISGTYDTDAFGLLRGGRELALTQLFGRLQPTANVVVDLALGTAESLLGLHARLPAAQLHGIDISARMLEQARRKLPEVNVIHDDAARMGSHFGPDSIDIALMHFLTTYVDTPAVIADVARSLRPGGFLSLVSSTYESFPAIHALALEVLPSELVKQLNPAPESGEVLAQQLRDAGLQIVEQASFEKSINFDSAPELALWGMKSGFFTHVLSVLPPTQVQAMVALSHLFPLRDRYHATALLAQKPQSTR
jgi:ubiquinone/menaquinone biosynthesis C-methylase UbiE